MSLFNKLYSQKNSCTSTGMKIRKIRKLKHISTKELASACDVNVNTIRNYELGIRQVSDEKLEVIAKRLGVNVSALANRRISTYVDAMHVLFELANEFDLIPTIIPVEPHYVLQTNDDTFLKAIKSWEKKCYEYNQKKIPLEEFKNWELSFPTQYKEESFTHGEDEKSISCISELERITSLKLALEQIDMIVNNHVLQISKTLDANDITEAKYQLNILQRTIESIISVDVKKYG